MGGGRRILCCDWAGPAAEDKENSQRQRSYCVFKFHKNDLSFLLVASQQLKFDLLHILRIISVFEQTDQRWKSQK